MRHLPDELILAIAAHLASAADLSALARTSTRLARCVDPVLYTRHGDPALAWAARHGRTATVRKTLVLGGVPSSVGEHLETAAERGHERIVRRLLAAYPGDKPEEEDATVRHGHRALAQAVRQGHAPTAALLLAARDKVALDARDASGRTLLSHAASGSGWPAAALVRRLLLAMERGVDADARDRTGRTPLSYAAAARDGAAVVALLLDTGRVDPAARDRDGRTPLSFAAAEGAYAAVERLLLLATGQDGGVDERDRLGWTPLMYAVVRGDEAVVARLLATGAADVQARDNYGRTPLSQARSRGYWSIARMLLDWPKEQGKV